jgi:cation diffusion facilitator CzcD-associated flavoprotein CzcO
MKMLDLADFDHDAALIVEGWLGRFNDALTRQDPALIADLFESESDWRDIVALTGEIITTSDRSAIATRLLADATKSGARGFTIAAGRLPPRRIERAGRQVIEALVCFRTNLGTGDGVLRLIERDGAEPSAWSLMTALDTLDAAPEREMNPAAGHDTTTDLDAPNWLDLRKAAIGFEHRDPAVLIVGGGHAGITAAAWLGNLGIEALIVDKMERIGDNWRKRYHSLKLHNQKGSNHLPFMPFPKNWPLYIPKDKIANWLEFYVDAMEINFWTETSFEGASYDPTQSVWSAQVIRADGSQRTLHPRHIIMATSVSGTPSLPDIPTLDRFKGRIVHSSKFGNGADWKGRPALVFGTGTSAHDIAQNLQANGALVTMVQRSPTLVVNVDPSAQLYDYVLLADGPSLADRDLINVASPLRQMKAAHKLITDQTREIDKPLLERLEKAGFRLEFGEDGTGWPLKYRTRGGGYYFNIGCSELIADGKIDLIQYAEIDTFTASGIRMKDGAERPAELAVLATGYKGPEVLVRQLFSDELADRIGPIWGFGEKQELRNLWTTTAQPGLWFTAGSFAQCREFSKYLALQIAIVEHGLN